jgi:hypothetical protein
MQNFEKHCFRTLLKAAEQPLRFGNVSDSKSTECHFTGSYTVERPALLASVKAPNKSKVSSSEGKDVGGGD